MDSVTGTLIRGYDGLGRMTSETTPQGGVTYAYDAASRRTGMTVAGQTAIGYSYDNASRLTGITQGTSAVSFAYDAANRRTSLTLPNGIVMSYSFDAGSQLTGIGYQLGQTNLGNLTYSYDLAGRRTSMGGSLATANLPNVISTTAYNANNQLTQWGTATPTYDANGNMLSDGTNTYVWDARNHLASMNLTGETFQYDPFGRRTAKTILSTTTNYLYDGANPVQELSGTTPTANILTGGVDEYFTRTDSTGTANFLTDALGSTISLKNSSGGTLASYSYEPFGNTTTTGSSTNTYQYTGRENDGTGVYFYRARYYSPSLQRFTSEDPTGFNGGSTNLYTYAQNSPTNMRDPSGKNPCLIGGLIGYNIYLGTQIVHELSGRYSYFGAGWGGAWRGIKSGWSWAAAGCVAGAGGSGLFNLGISAAENEAVFWTGEGAQSAAQELGTTLSDTPIGSAFDAIDEYLPASWKSAGWNFLSDQFAANATGDINVVVGSNSWGGSTFWQIEFPELVNSTYSGQVGNWAWTLVP